MFKWSAISPAGVGRTPASGAIAPRRFQFRTEEGVLVFLLAVVLLALVMPPLVSLVETAIVDEKTGELTLDNFRSILPNLVRADLLSNTLIFAFATAAVSFVFGSMLAWFAERTNAPFRRILYVSAFLSLALPNIVQVLGWVFLLGRRQGFINVLLVDRIGILSAPFDVQSMAGMIFVESILWTAVVFLLMAVPFRSMDATLEEAGRAARGSATEVFVRITLRLAMPAGLSVLLISVVRNLEAFEVPAILGLPGGVHVLTTQIFTKLHATVLPDHGEVSAYSVLLILFVIPLLFAYHRATRGQGRYATITGKGLRTTRLNLGRYRWIAGAFMLTLPALILMPILMLGWLSLLDFYQLPSAAALDHVSLDNYRSLFGANSQILGSFAFTFAVAAASATSVVLLSAIACWAIVRTRVPGRSALEFISVVPLVIPSIVLGIGVLWAYIALPVPIYGTVGILLIAFMIRALPFVMRSSYAGALSISAELEESAVVAGARKSEMFVRVFLPLMLPAMFAGWQYAFLQTARELPVALLLQSSGHKMISVWIWNLWELGQVTNAAALSVIVAVLIGAAGWGLEALSRRIGVTSARS
jgi:iron(III) transport system permease protein